MVLHVHKHVIRFAVSTSMSINQLETVNKSENVIPIYLPEGEWFLELSPLEDKGPWFASTAPVVVRRSQNPMEITLHMAK